MLDKPSSDKWADFDRIQDRKIKKKEKEAKRIAQRPYYIETNPRTQARIKKCKRIGKQCYDTQEKADKAASGALIRKTANVVNLRVYKCPFCNLFHLTSKEFRPPNFSVDNHANPVNVVESEKKETQS